MFAFLLQHTPIFYLTQSIWRDETFSIFFAQRSPMTFFHLAFEPPLYYFFLHYWMKLFGTSEIAARSLSLLGFSLATIVVIYWAEKLFKKHWLSWYLPVFFFFNPMLLYYAFEIRAYGWYMFFAVLSMYAYIERRWKLYIFATTLGLYTHTYMITVPAVQLIHYLFTTRLQFSFKHIRHIQIDPMIRSVGIVGLLFAPWLYKVITELPNLKYSWYFPVDQKTILSGIGNIFLAYEGTPWYLWDFTAKVSLILTVAFIYSLTDRKSRSRNSFFVLMIFIPLIVIVGISFYKSLFVIRYVIPSTIAEIFACTFAIALIKNKTLQKIIAAAALLFVFGFNLWYPDKYPKLDIRKTMTEVNSLMTKNDVVLADSAVIFFDTMYYSRNPSRVYYYDLKGDPFPWYVGDSIVTPSKIVYGLPPYPIRAFIVHADGTYEISYNTNISYNPVNKKLHK